MDRLHNQILLLFSIPIYAVIIPLEILISNFGGLKYYSLKETLVNIYLNALNTGLDILLRFLIGLNLLNFFYQYHVSIQWNEFAYWALLTKTATGALTAARPGILFILTLSENKHEFII